MIKCLKGMLEDSHDVICVSCALFTELGGMLYFNRLCVYVYLAVHAFQVEPTSLI